MRLSSTAFLFASLGAFFALAAGVGDATAQAAEYEADPAERPVHDPPRAGRVPARVEDGMVHVPGATFVLGSDGGVWVEPNEHPAHLVRVAPFWIDRTEVTLGAYLACVASGACPAPGATGRCTAARGDAELPVSCVPWSAAERHCAWIGRRLPTEAEWELAARGVERGAFPWGDGQPSCERAVTLRSSRSGRSCSPDGPARVGSRPRGASPYGVLDMAGNVEEWVSDFFADRYPAPGPSPVDGPRGPAWGAAHVLRGGSWLSWPRQARAAARSWGAGAEAGPTVGFRCARDG